MDLNISEYIPVKPLTLDAVTDVMVEYIKLCHCEMECAKAFGLDAHGIQFDLIDSYMACMLSSNLTYSGEGLIDTIKNWISKLVNCIQQLVSWIGSLFQKANMNRRVDDVCRKLEQMYLGKPKSSNEAISNKKDKDPNTPGIQTFKFDPPFPSKENEVAGAFVSVNELAQYMSLFDEILSTIDRKVPDISAVLKINLKQDASKIQEHIDEFIETAHTAYDTIISVVKECEEKVAKLNSIKFKSRKLDNNLPGNSDTKNLIGKIRESFRTTERFQTTFSGYASKLKNFPTGVLSNEGALVGDDRTVLMHYLKSIMEYIRSVRDAVAAQTKLFNEISGCVDTAFYQMFPTERSERLTAKEIAKMSKNK
mgnify:CR=1 FL=1